MANPVGKHPAPPVPVPTTPTVEAWRAMTPAERMDFQVRVIEALNAASDMMGEGRPHKNAKARVIDALGLHFKATGRVVYLAEEMSVLYPGVEPFTPDILAVLDVEAPEEDERMTWAVADEGKGLDLVIEVLHKGNRDKDLVDNVERYATLGIPEYFVYDRLRHKIHAYRLPAPGALRYQRVMPQLGRYHSNVLGLDLAIFGTELRFLAGEAELPGSAKLIGRLQGMVLSVEARAEQAEADAEQARAEAAMARAEAVLIVLGARGLAATEAERERIMTEDDAGRLGRWLARAVVAGSIGEVLDDRG